MKHQRPSMMMTTTMIVLAALTTKTTALTLYTSINRKERRTDEQALYDQFSKNKNKMLFSNKREGKEKHVTSCWFFSSFCVWYILCINTMNEHHLSITRPDQTTTLGVIKIYWLNYFGPKTSMIRRGRGNEPHTTDRNHQQTLQSINWDDRMQYHQHHNPFMAQFNRHFPICLSSPIVCLVVFVLCRKGGGHNFVYWFSFSMFYID